MPSAFIFDRVQFFSILFSLFIFYFIFSLVKKRRMKEEYSLLWFTMSLFLLYMSLDRFAIDRLGSLVGVAYPPSVLMLLTTGFTFLMLIHLSVVISRLSEQNNELIQEMGLQRLGAGPKGADTLVIVPAYNEGENIVRVIEDLKGIDLALDVLVVNDGSSDNTCQAAQATGKALVVDLPKNLGIGGAVQTGFKYANRNGYRIAVQFDGDGQHIAGEIAKLVGVLESHGANMVIGSRFLKKHGGFRSTFVRRIGIQTFQVLNSLLIGQKITDNTSGFRVYDRKAIEFLSRYYPVDYPEPEAVILMGRNGFRIEEEFALMRERQGGDSSIAGMYGIYYMIKVVLAIVMTALRKPLTGGKNRSDTASTD